MDNPAATSEPVTTAACIVTPQWTSSVQLVLSQINAAKNVLELLRENCLGRVGGMLSEREPVRLLQHDGLVIAALLKKNKSQHRCNRSWQRMEGVRRSLRAILTEASSTSATRACRDLASFLHALERAAQPVTTHQERQVPTGEGRWALVAWLYGRLKELERLLARARAAAEACAAQLAHTHFMPLSLTGLALVARVYAAGVVLLREGVSLFNLLQEELVGLLPRVHPTADVSHLGNVVQTPRVLRCRVKQGELVRMEVVEASDNSIHPQLQPEGLRVLGADEVRLQEQGLVVEEDHGQVVSRDEVYAALGIGGGNRVLEEVVPMFEESTLRIDAVRVSTENTQTPEREKEREKSEVAATDETACTVKRKRVELEAKGEKETIGIGVASKAESDVSAVQFVRINAPPPRQPPTACPPVESGDPEPKFKPKAKPLITRLEEEKKRKRKKKTGGGSKGPSPSAWDDLF